MELSSLAEKYFTWERFSIAVLVIFMVFGMATKLYLSANMGLNSDTVGMGLESMEVWKHQNYLLSGYHVTAADTFFFTELVPFQLVPQILTNYNPLTLKLVSYVIFALAVLVLAILVFFASGSKISALLFAALAANIPPDAYWPLAMPTTHNATIVFGGLILLILLYMNRQQQQEASKPKTGKRRKEAVKPENFQWPYLAGMAILVFTTVLSDSIVLLWFLVPYVLAYLLVYKGKTKVSNLAVLAILALSTLAYVIKTYMVPDWVVQSPGSRGLSEIISVNIPLFFTIQAQYLCTGLFKVITGAAGMGVIDYLSIVLFAAILLYAGRSALQDRQKWFFYAILLLSVVTMFAGFIASEYARDMGGARYLTFTALAVIMFVSISYDHLDRLFGALLLAFLALSVIYGYVYVSTVDLQPNAKEYELISYLKGQGLDYGYGSYWESNVVTYLSGEDVTIRSVLLYPDHIQPNGMLACDRWYDYEPDKTFIIVENSTLDDRSRSIINSLGQHFNFSQPLPYQQYDIYPFTVPKPGAGQ